MDYRKTGVIAIVAVLVLGVPAWGESTGSIWLTFTGVNPTRFATVSDLSGVYYVGTFNFLVDESQDPTGDGLKIAENYGGDKGPVRAYCIDIKQTISSNPSSNPYLFNVWELEDAPIGGGNSPMGSTKAAYLDRLFTNYEPGGAGTLIPLNDDTAAAFAACVWEIINETDTIAGYGLGTGNFRVTPDSYNGSPTDWDSIADNSVDGWLHYLGSGGADPSALVSTVTQDFAMIIPGVGGGLVIPEPVTMLSAFLAIGSLGLYLRRRTRAGA